MRQRSIVILLGIFLGAGLLSGCAKTPEESLVKQKGEASLKNYEEGEALRGEQSESEALEGDAETGTSEELAENGVETEDTETNILRESLGAPKHYQSEVVDETGKLKIVTNADVEIPDANKVSAIAVSQHPFEQTMIDRITDTFFPEAEIYTYDSYNARTKADYQKEIEELKGYVAEGNLDPYHFGTDEAGNYYYDIYHVIEEDEQMMQEAPEEKNPVKVHPQYGLDGDTQGDDRFCGVACQPDGTSYLYLMKTYSGMPMEVRLEKMREKESNTRWMGYSMASVGGFSDLPEEKAMADAIGITLEEAQKIADEKTALLQLENMEMTSWEYGICYVEDDFSQTENAARKISDMGYMLHYTRKLNGIPITYTTSWGGSLENMDSEMEPWAYEVLDFIVTKDGIDTVHFNNQYDIGEIRTENLNLLSFDKIMEIYEKMMLIQNADALNYAFSQTYRIDRITFGYSRIYEPAADSRSGLLVPVWDFFGSNETVYDNNGQQESSISRTQYNSCLTINAIDGSMINRGLGY